MGKGQWQFEGGGFHESLPEGRTAGTLEVSPVSVKFVSDAGTVEMPVMQILDAGRMAILSDPEGARLSIWEAGEHIGAGLVNEPNSLAWNDLGTRDAGAAGADMWLSVRQGRPARHVWEPVRPQ